MSDDISFIAHDPDAQALMDKYDLAWGTQYEIARGISDRSWTWNEVTPDVIQSLRGSNEDSASRVDKVLGRSKARSNPIDKVWYV